MYSTDYDIRELIKGYGKDIIKEEDIMDTINNIIQSRKIEAEFYINNLFSSNVIIFYNFIDPLIWTF
jgi:hypothetical protein